MSCETEPSGNCRHHSLGGRNAASRRTATGGQNAANGAQHPVTSPEERAALQRVIDQNAPVLKAQAAVLKAVAKLLGPTVVHIEADVPRRGLMYPKSPELEESGSGVIIEQNSRYYVLTNWHVFRNTAADGIRIFLADGRMVHPPRVLKDEETDVGVLPVEAADLIAAPWATATAWRSATLCWPPAAPSD